MSEELSNLLAESIEAIEQGRLTAEEFLEAHPEYREELDQLLSTVAQVQELPAAPASAEFRQAARARLLAKLPPRVTDSDGRVSDGDLSAAIVFVRSSMARGLQSAGQKAAAWWPLPLRPSLAAGAVLLVVIVLLAGLWFRGRVTTSPGTETLVAETGTKGTSQNTPPKTGRGASESQEEMAAAGAGFRTLMPVITSPLDLNPGTAAVEALRGIVEVQNGAGEWLLVNHVTPATAGQRVRTGAFSGATITFNDGSQVTLEANTEISLDELDAQLPEDGLRTVVMTQWVGESEHHVDFRDDAGSRYEVKTPNGSGRARGTIFQVIVTPELQGQYIVSEGRVDVTHLGVTVFVTAGQVSLVSPEEPPSEPYFTVSGQGEVTAMGETWTIGAQTFATSASTVIVGNPQIGDIVTVYGYMLPDGTLVATLIILQHHAPGNRFTLTGIVDSIGADEWIVAGQTIAVNAETIVDDSLAVGDLARVHGIITAGDGTFLAQRIERVDEDRRPFEFTGVVQNIGSETWSISGLAIAINDDTMIGEGITVGDLVEVEGEILADGTWLAHAIHLREDESDFEFTGLVEGINPWLVAGVSFETDVYTVIDEGIEVGDLVYVEGQILDDGTWLATVIRLVSDETLTFTLVGVVDSIDPWVVNGVPLAVDDDTLIDDDILVGDLVLARGFILPDGTWLATMIERLDEDPVGCHTFTTTVLSIDGDLLALEGLPSITLPDDDDLVEGEIAPNVVVTVTICVTDDGSIIVISIVVIVAITPVPPSPPPGTEPPGTAGYVTICHKPGTPAEKTKVLPAPALSGHLGHGDYLGSCR